MSFPRTSLIRRRKPDLTGSVSAGHLEICNQKKGAFDLKGLAKLHVPSDCERSVRRPHLPGHQPTHLLPQPQEESPGHADFLARGFESQSDASLPKSSAAP